MARGLDHVQKHNDRVDAFDTRLPPGLREFSCQVRARTSGTFTAADGEAEEMRAP